MSGDYRPEWRWLLMGPLIGAFAGVLVAFAMLLIGFAFDSMAMSPTEVFETVGLLAVLAVIYGGLSGAAVGLLSGLPLVFFVGRHLAAPVARRRARVLGATLSPVAMLGALSLVAGEVVDLPRLEWSVIGWLLATAALGGSLAARTATRVLRCPRVS